MSGRTSVGKLTETTAAARPEPGRRGIDSPWVIHAVRQAAKLGELLCHSDVIARPLRPPSSRHISFGVLELRTLTRPTNEFCGSK